tara:strand:- start:126 stop:383 length:258 start_codon:yes stop_codon:yes gene_type:complete
MPIVSSKFSDKEHAAIVEFAAQQGDTISNVLRKACIASITLLDYDSIKPEYEFQEWVNTAEGDETEMQDNANVISDILGWEHVSV